jgi:triosephosphate isomerase
MAICLGNAKNEKSGKREKGASNIFRGGISRNEDRIIAVEPESFVGYDLSVPSHKYDQFDD